MRKVFATLIIVLISIGWFTAVRNRPIAYHAVCQTDAFLCESLKNISVEAFEQKIQAGSVLSYDGSATVTRTWEQDEAGNYRYTSKTQENVTDEVVDVDGVHYVKDLETSAWRVAGEEKDRRSRASIVDQLSLDEIVGQYYPGSGKLSGYSFKKIEESMCNGQPCLKYAAESTAKEPAYRQEYLYFTNDKRLVRYDERAPEYRAEHRYAYTSIPSITPPRVQ